MPRKSINYSKTIIYHFVCNNPEITYTYVGNTTNYVNRKNKHKKDCHNEKYQEQEVYKVINENGGWKNWEMVPLEEYPCENEIQARIREQYWIDTLKAKMNSIRAHQTTEDRRIQKREAGERRNIRTHIDDDYGDKERARKTQWKRDNKELCKARNDEWRKKPETKKYYAALSRWHRHKKKPYEDVFYGSCVFKLLK